MRGCMIRPACHPPASVAPSPRKDRARSSSRSGPGGKTPPGRIGKSSGMGASGRRCDCSRGRGCGTRPVRIRWRSATCWRVTPRARWRMRAISVLPFLSANRGRKEPLDRENPAVPHLKTEEPGYLCTEEEMLPAEIMRYMVWRWSVEVTFEEMRTHLGMETQRQWSDLAIERTTPELLGLDSLVVLAAVRCHKAGLLSAEETAWYAKEEPTFSDCLRLIRSRIWQARMSTGTHESSDLIQFPRELLDALIHGLASAA